MFIGHYAPAFVLATRKDAPKLGTLFIAVQLVDIAFFSFLPLGIEHMRIVPGITAMNPFDLYDMPYTHSLLGALLWSFGFGMFVAFATATRRTGVIAGLAVLSHWFLDLVVHRPDLALYDHHRLLGLGLWNHPKTEMTLELLIFSFAFLYYLQRTRPLTGRTNRPLWTMWIALFMMQAINWFGPEPASLVNIYASGLAAYGVAFALAVWLAGSRRVLSPS